MTRNFQTIIFGGAIMVGSSNTIAQTCGVEYTTEWQADFKGDYDWLNQLKVSAALPVGDYLTIEATTISAAKTNENTLMDDLLTYSNIEAGNIPLTFARLGMGVTVKDAEFFVGVNNVNEDYFTSDMTSFFTNSSFGISPTISCNFDIANYPLASWCAHYRQKIDSVTIQTSLYPGQGYSRIAGHDNIFSLDLKRDGIFSISSIDYQRHGINCILGIALHYGMCMGDEDAEPQETAPTTEKRFTATPWILSEIVLPYNLGLCAHGSYSSVKQGCKGYGGLGLIYQGEYAQPGVALNYAKFSDISEFAVEFTCRIPLDAYKAYLQPTVHLVRTDQASTKCVGMMRLCINI